MQSQLWPATPFCAPYKLNKTLLEQVASYMNKACSLANCSQFQYKCKQHYTLKQIKKPKPLFCHKAHKCREYSRSMEEPYTQFRALVTSSWAVLNVHGLGFLIVNSQRWMVIAEKGIPAAGLLSIHVKNENKLNQCFKSLKTRTCVLKQGKFVVCFWFNFVPKSWTFKYYENRNKNKLYLVYFFKLWVLPSVVCILVVTSHFLFNTALQRQSRGHVIQDYFKLLQTHLCCPLSPTDRIIVSF